MLRQGEPACNKEVALVENYLTNIHGELLDMIATHPNKVKAKWTIFHESDTKNDVVLLQHKIKNAYNEFKDMRSKQKKLTIFHPI